MVIIEYGKTTPRKSNWNKVWKEAVLKLPKKDTTKSWDKVAPKFDEWMKKDDYPEELVNKINVENGDTVLDIGSGNGAITIPLAKKARSVTALDVSTKMLNLLKEKAEQENIPNIKCIKKKIEDLNAEEIGQHDVVVASRSLNGIADIQPELEKINKIAQKYVYITLWGINNREFESKIARLMGRQSYDYPDYTIVLNILKDIGIHAHGEPLKSNTLNFYSNLDEALDKIEWRIGDLNEKEKVQVKEYIAKTLTKNTDASFTYSRANSKWVLIWWNKQENDSI